MISSPVLHRHILVSCVFKVFCYSTFSEKRKASFCYNLGLLLQLDISECSVHQHTRVYHLLQGSPKIASGKLKAAALSYFIHFTIVQFTVLAEAPTNFG